MQRFFVAAVAIAMAACTTAVPPVATPVPAPEPVAVTNQNPLLASWSGPHGGIPPFAGLLVRTTRHFLETYPADSWRESC